MTLDKIVEFIGRNKLARISMYTLYSLFTISITDGFFSKLFGQEKYKAVKLIENAYYPNWSPDGTKIAFSRSGTNKGIYIVNSNGTNEKKLTEHGEDLSWSYDGKKIAFEIDDRDLGVGESTNIYTIDTTGNNLHKLTNVTEAGDHALNPAWSLDNWIIYSHDKDGPDHDIFKISPDGGTPIKIINKGMEADWSFDSKYIAFERDYDIWKFNTINSVETLIADVKYGRFPSWSPDGKKIVFEARKGLKKQIYLISSNGNSPEQIIFDVPGDEGFTNSYHNGCPSFSSDGKKIAFVHSPSSGRTDVWIAYLEGEPSINLSLDQKTIKDNLLAENITERKGIIKRIMDVILGFSDLSSSKGYSTDATINLDFTGDVDKITKVNGYFSAVEIEYQIEPIEFNQIETGKYSQRIKPTNKTNLAINAVIDAVNIISITQTGETFDLPVEIKDVTPTVKLDSIVITLTTGSKSFAINDTLPRWDKAMKTEVDHLFDELMGNTVITKTYSPVEFLIKDPRGNKLGIENGTEFNDIPYSYFNQKVHPKISIIFGDDKYDMNLKGKSTGTFDLKVYKNNKESGIDSVLYDDVSIQQNHTAKIDVGTNVIDDTLRVYDENDNPTGIITNIKKIKNKKNPKEFKLSQNYPNPFNPLTHIKFELNKYFKDVDLKIYDVNGQMIIDLVDGAFQPGTYTIEWTGKNENGIKVASGMYIYRLKAGKNIKSEKMILLK